MLPFKLMGKTPVGYHVETWACGQCGRVCSSQDDAIECCRPRMCECGERAEKHRAMCRACLKKQDADREQRKYNRGRKISWADYQEPCIYSPHTDRYYDDPEDLYDDFEAGEELPEYAFGVVKENLEIDAVNVVDREIEAQGWFEGAEKRVKDYTALQTALDAICAEIGPSFREDSNTVVIF